MSFECRTRWKDAGRLVRGSGRDGLQDRDRAGLLLIQAIGACDQALADMKAEGRHPKPLADLSPADAFARVGAAEWDPRREQYREPAVKDAAE